MLCVCVSVLRTDRNGWVYLVGGDTVLCGATVLALQFSIVTAGSVSSNVVLLPPVVHLDMFLVGSWCCYVFLSCSDHECPS